jgi:NADP-dependent 3-hydroxy acid dehydrogenase YdfG
MTSTLTGKTAIITGASSGIGEATARLLAKRGCNVVLAARREDRLESLVSDLGDEQTLATPTDVTDPSACVALVDRTLDHFGSLDVLVNNAGLGLYAPITEADPEDPTRRTGAPCSTLTRRFPANQIPALCFRALLNEEDPKVKLMLASS